MKKTLLTTALLLTLTACTSDRPEWLGGEPKRPAADVKMGARRAPVLNNQSLQQMAPPEREMPSMMVPPPPPPPAPDNRVMNEEDVRKPFGVDPAYSTETVATVPAPELVVSPETKAAMAETPKLAEEPKQQNWVSRMGERLSGEPESPEVEKAKAQPYPKLSDVPPRPAEFGSVKNTHDAKMQEMTAEHAAADMQREALTAEPSQTGGATLLGHAYDPKQGPAAGTPNTAAVVSTMESPPGEMLPKKVEAPKVEEKPVAKKPAAKKPTKKTPAKKTKPAAKVNETTKASEPVTTDAPKMSVPEQGLY